MTETFQLKNIYNVDNRTYGGELTLFDFEGHHTLATMTNKIVKSWNFDKKCETNKKITQRNFRMTRLHK